MVVNEKYPEIHIYVNTVHIGYSDNAEDIDLGKTITISNISLYPIHYVWVPCRRGFILRDNNITISNIYCIYLGSPLVGCIKMFQLWRLGISPFRRNKLTYFHTFHGDILRNNLNQSNSVLGL